MVVIAAHSRRRRYSYQWSSGLHSWKRGNEHIGSVLNHGTFQFVAVLVCGLSVCGRFGLWPLRFVAVPVCGRFGLWPFWFVAVHQILAFT